MPGLLDLVVALNETLPAGDHESRRLLENIADYVDFGESGRHRVGAKGVYHAAPARDDRGSVAAAVDDGANAKPVVPQPTGSGATSAPLLIDLHADGGDAVAAVVAQPDGNDAAAAYGLASTRSGTGLLGDEANGGSGRGPAAAGRSSLSSDDDSIIVVGQLSSDDDAPLLLDEYGRVVVAGRPDDKDGEDGNVSPSGSDSSWSDVVRRGKPVPKVLLQAVPGRAKKERQSSSLGKPSSPSSPDDGEEWPVAAAVKGKRGGGAAAHPPGRLHREAGKGAAKKKLPSPCRKPDQAKRPQQKAGQQGKKPEGKRPAGKPSGAAHLAGGGGRGGKKEEKGQEGDHSRRRSPESAPPRPAVLSVPILDLVVNRRPDGGSSSAARRELVGGPNSPGTGVPEESRENLEVHPLPVREESVADDGQNAAAGADGPELAQGQEVVPESSCGSHEDDAEGDRVATGLARQLSATRPIVRVYQRHHDDGVKFLRLEHERVTNGNGRDERKLVVEVLSDRNSYLCSVGAAWLAAAEADLSPSIGGRFGNSLSADGLYTAATGRALYFNEHSEGRTARSKNGLGYLQEKPSCPQLYIASDVWQESSQQLRADGSAFRVRELLSVQKRGWRVDDGADVVHAVPGRAAVVLRGSRRLGRVRQGKTPRIDLPLLFVHSDDWKRFDSWAKSGAYGATPVQQLHLAGELGDCGPIVGSDWWWAPHPVSCQISGRLYPSECEATFPKEVYGLDSGRRDDWIEQRHNYVLNQYGLEAGWRGDTFVKFATRL